MALLAAATLNPTTHLSLRSRAGRNSENLWLRSAASSQKSKGRFCNLTIRAGTASKPAEPIGPVFTKLKPWQIPKRDWFDKDFLFGASTSAYQIEGAWNEDGKGPSTWDHFCHTYPERISDMTNGDVAANSYHLYEEDVKALKDMGMKVYRFSISWSRILPDGTGKVNQAGIDYYNKLINSLIDNDIVPYVTIWHWDTPQALEDKYGGFLNRQIVDDYKQFAEVCFKNFGDRVKNWFTFNEPHTYCCFSYGEGIHAPGRCSPGMDCAVPEGDSLREPYTAGHHILLAHAEAVQLFKARYNMHGDSKIGMAFDVMGYEPYQDSFLDDQARERSIDYNMGWFLEPVVRGDYPFSMRSLIGDRLPMFTKEEQEKLASSCDIMGLNYYTSRFSKHVDMSPDFTPTLNTDDAYASSETTGSDGNDIGPITGTYWIYMYPKGLTDLLLIMKEKYGNPPVFITENGIADVEGDESMPDPLDDWKRLDYLQRHISAVKDAIDQGADVRGHFTWGLIDNFEWSLGYSSRFGLVYIDKNDGNKRKLKKSAKWFSKFNSVPKPLLKTTNNNATMTAASVSV
ncbi:4-hydroxy-7-methoxy-3-oxo-3,4-dihydro-2H-1,4-benzoxazin-2-yl glucoside beta-D-glucosidase 1b, chloroplastic-like [Triticum dicoccoides]|uniref:4-hydroxy-7-methoxy-3-oxo-3,4-dihydro-2H-1, 4-benzoxazin-2-yl glucoside beta-D-glucosidase 1b, chloroplastic-like n=1 Tax=Triticum dicoccoides TaxID=85692 RepID=UPI00188DF43C|nr:4-hydroxy-7-methoxy-3-oxo-3,4-dihydro-2H-1,4-benzoxazin-2-yl glucoside beta-D-glucosidase 1b, chloroplastic-like [Triticum dicoccoides]